MDKNILFQEMYQCCPDAAVFTVLPGFDVPHKQANEVEPNLPVALISLYKPQYKSYSGGALSQLVTETFRKISVNEHEAKFLESSTRRQTATEIWFHYRKGLITASHFHEVLHHKWVSYPTSIVKSIMQYQLPNPNIPALKWGRDNEDNGIKEYMSHNEQKHSNLKYCSSGLTVSTVYPFIGASPDGKVSCECCGDGLIEVKCTFKYRDVIPIADTALSDSNYFLKKHPSSGEVILDRCHKYYYQVQAQLSICNFSYCDFICWTQKGIFVERIEKEDDFLARSLPQLTRFFKEYLLPEILTCKVRDSYSDSTTINSKSCSSKRTAQNVFCLCQKEEYGTMIACDNSMCSIEWFHLDCVGLKRAPMGKWYCSSCRK